jgi:hypothetical protein
MSRRSSTVGLWSIAVGASLVVPACGASPPATTHQLERLNAVLAADTRPTAPADTCVRIHEVWRDQLRVGLAAAGLPARKRPDAFLEAIYLPHETFWQGYVGGRRDFIRQVMGRWGDLETDPRASVPLDVDVTELIVQTTRRAADLANRPAACTNWYLIYGPGWANLGGGPMGMLVDFLGLPRGREAEDLRNHMPHEIGHLIFARARGSDPDTATLLHRIVEEGFVSYFAVQYAAGSLSAAESLGYTDEQWAWAKQHERELWELAVPHLRSRDREVIDPFRSARARVMPGAPGKIGYFLGYRMVEEYVARHGAASWRDIFDLPLASVLSESGYGI